MITQEILNELLKYDHETGLLFWRERDTRFFNRNRDCSAWNARYAGKIAGSIKNDGYIMVDLLGKRYQASRLIWVYVYGEITLSEIDHINGIRSDNRLSNLRQVSRGENSKNHGMHMNNKSGITGVVWNKKIGKWQAQISVEKRSIYLGVFSSKEAACAARKQANIKYGFTERHGL